MCHMRVYTRLWCYVFHTLGMDQKHGVTFKNVILRDGKGVIQRHGVARKASRVLLPLTDHVLNVVRSISRVILSRFANVAHESNRHT